VCGLRRSSRGWRRSPRPGETVPMLIAHLFDPRKRHPVKTADAEWGQPVFVLNLPNSYSTRERADGQVERLLLAWTGLGCRHGRATEGVACGWPRVRSRPWRRLSPRPDGEDREHRRSRLVFDGDGCSRVRASAIVRIEVEGRPDTPHDPVERRSS